MTVKSSKKTAEKARLLREIKQGLREVKQIRERKAKAYSMADLFDLKKHL
jgi:hypothetical protein